MLLFGGEVEEGGGGGRTVIISKSCMNPGFEPAKRHSIDSTNAASAQIKGTITENRILCRTLSSHLGMDVVLMLGAEGGLVVDR
jgi:hypothetical protein